MITSRFVPLALVLGSLTPIHAQYKAIFNFGAYGNPSCPYGEIIAQSPGGNLVSANYSACSDNAIANPPAAYEIGFQGANFTMLQQFTAPFAWPVGGLTLGTDQRFHGTINGAGARNHGAVYRLSPSGAIVYEHSFEGGADGGYPSAAPIQGADGAYYGTTVGASSAYAGTVYKIDTSQRYSVLHVFTTTDGRSPGSPLVQGTDLNFYGTTSSGGQNGLGTFFRISSTGNFAVLHDFNSAEGGFAGPLIQASDGNFYGPTYGNGTTTNGTIVKITPTGAVTTLDSFLGGLWISARRRAGRGHGWKFLWHAQPRGSGWGWDSLPPHACRGLYKAPRLPRRVRNISGGHSYAAHEWETLRYCGGGRNV